MSTMAEVDRRPSSSLSLGAGSHGNKEDVFQNESREKATYTDSHINTRFRHFCRAYIVDQLRKHGFGALADKYANFESFDDGFEQVLHQLAGNLAEERKRQFEDMLIGLKLTDKNLSETYQVIVHEVFVEGVNWGRILTFLVFSGSLTVYCAQENLEGRVGDIISWTENVIEKTITNWVARQGGWRAFVDHFDDGSWTIERPAYFLAGAVTVVLGGLYLLRKLF